MEELETPTREKSGNKELETTTTETKSHVARNKSEAMYAGECA